MSDQVRVVCEWKNGQIVASEWMQRADWRIRNLLSQVDHMRWVRLEHEGDPNNRETR
jgi:Ni/Co efflux regulator RcnB